MFDPSNPFLLFHLVIITVNTTSMDKNFDKNILLAGLSHGTVRLTNSGCQGIPINGMLQAWQQQRKQIFSVEHLYCNLTGFTAKQMANSIHHKAINVGHVHHRPNKGT